MDRMVEAFAAAQRMIDELAHYGLDRETLVNDFENDCELPCGMWWNCGASRIVIGDEMENYVLKIASTQNYEKYNQREVEVYQRAVEEGLEDNFAWCACYLEPYTEDGVYLPGIYVMERLDGNEDEVRDSAWVYGYQQYCKVYNWLYKDLSHASDYNNWSGRNYEDDDDLLDYLTSFIKESDMIRKFYCFIEDERVDDLHCGNFLFRNERLVICDYAGWNW